MLTNKKVVNRNGMNEQDKKILHVKRLLSSKSAGIRTLYEGQHFKNAESLCKLMRLRQSHQDCWFLGG